MKFTRRKKRGLSQKTRRLWLSESGYRIVWRREISGVEVPARFQATVRLLIGEREMWDHVSRRRLFKTIKPAQEACEAHEKQWGKACAVTGLRQLIEIFGRIPLGLPKWCRSKMPRKFQTIILEPRKRTIEEDDD